MFGWFLFGGVFGLFVFSLVLLVLFSFRALEKRTVISKDCSVSSAFLDQSPCGKEQGDGVSVRSFDHCLRFVLTNKSHKYKETRLCYFSGSEQSLFCS